MRALVIGVGAVLLGALLASSDITWSRFDLLHITAYSWGR